MPNFVYTIIQICLFRARPQDLPASSTLLLISSTAAFIVFLVRNSLLGSNGNAIGIALVQIILLAGFLRILVGLFSKPERWLQSTTALMGCSAVIVGLIIPLLLGNAGTDFIQEGLSLVKLGVVVTSIWYFAMMVFILRQTLEIRIALGFIIALLMELSMASILFRIFGDHLL